MTLSPGLYGVKVSNYSDSRKTAAALIDFELLNTNRLFH